MEAEVYWNFQDTNNLKFNLNNIPFNKRDVI